MDKLKIECSCKDSLPLKELVDFQGELKKRTDSDIKRIISSIEEHGFTFPFFVWKNDDKNYVLDGHGRLSALKKMKRQGCEILNLPVIYVNCKDESDAKDLLLKINSEYGKMTKESILKFVNGDFKLDTSDFALSIGKIDFFARTEITEPTEYNPSANPFEDSFDEPFNSSFADAENERFNSEPEFVPESEIIDYPQTTIPNSVIEETLPNGVEDDRYSEPSQPQYLEKHTVAPPERYFLTFNEIQFETTEQEYLMFREFLSEYYNEKNTTIGVMYELFKKFA